MKNIEGKISVIMPAYNEAGRIASSIEETAKTMIDFGCEWELVVVDDGSTDDTFRLANRLASSYPGKLTVKKNYANQGKGWAIKEGLHCITGDYVVFLDADLDLHPLQIQALIDIMRMDNADIVIGSKLHPNSVVNYPLERRMASFLYYLLIRLMFNLPCHDTQTGLKLFKTKVAQRLFSMILVKKFAFDLEVLANAHRLGYKIAEAPIILDSRRRFGRIGAKAVFEVFYDTLAVFYRLRILKYYDRIDNNRG